MPARCLGAWPCQRWRDRARDREPGSPETRTFAPGSRLCTPPGKRLWVRKSPWRREWQHTPVPLPGEFHGQRSLVGYSPWDGKESGKTEQLTHIKSEI